MRKILRNDYLIVILKNFGVLLIVISMIDIAILFKRPDFQISIILALDESLLFHWMLFLLPFILTPIEIWLKRKRKDS